MKINWLFKNNNETMSYGFSGCTPNSVCRRMTGLESRRSTFTPSFSRRQESVAESGRSMTETLGVLIIIGVLSVGGIVGYTYGMNKYRANRTSQDISLRVISLISKQFNATSDTSDEWKNQETLYPIDVIQDTEISQTAIRVSDVPQEVCQILFNDLIGTYSIKVGDEKYTETAVNVCDMDNTMLFYLPQKTTTEEGMELEKCGDKVCEMCQTCDITTQTCVVATNYTTKCMDGTNFGWCVNGECQVDACETCGSKQYCGDANSSTTKARPSTCKDLKFKEVVIEGKTYLYSEEKLSWWDSQSACAALKKKMVSVTDVVDGIDFDKAGTAGYSRDGTLNSVGQKLQETVGSSNWIWTNTFCSKCSSPSFFGINMKDGYIQTGSRNSTSRYTVCQ